MKEEEPYQYFAGMVYYVLDKHSHEVKENR